MYSRKQFFLAVAGRCFDLFKSCHSLFAIQNEDHANESAGLVPESLFLEAISLGIDPGTMDVKQLIMAINSLKADTKS